MSRKNQSIFTLINTALLLILIAIFIFQKTGFSFKSIFCRKIPEKSFSSVKIPSESTYQEILRFAVIGDIHIGAWSESENYLTLAIKKAIEKKAAFLVLLGDLTQNGSKEQYNSLKKILEDSGLPFYVVPGNHDIGREAVDNGLQNFREIFGEPSGKVLLKLNSKGKINKVRLFLLDTSYYGSLLETGQLVWLKEEFDKGFNPEELRIVFSQAPYDKLTMSDGYYFREFICNGFIDGLFEADLHRTEFFRRDCPLPLFTHKNDPETPFRFNTFKVGALFQPEKEFSGFLMIYYLENRFVEFERIVLTENNQ